MKVSQWVKHFGGPLFTLGEGQLKTPPNFLTQRNLFDIRGAMLNIRTKLIGAVYSTYGVPPKGGVNPLT